MIVEEKVQPKRIDMICPQCGHGRMRSDGTVLTSYPAQYPHECNACGFIETYYVSYPYIVWEEISDSIS